MTWIDLAGTVNARDLGGMPTVDGRTTRHSVLLRADNLQDLSADDVAELQRRGVGTVVDLRTSAEVEVLGPGPLAQAPVKHVHLDLIPHGFEGRSVLDRTLPDENAPEHAVDHLYFDYVRDAPEQVATALRTIADPAAGAVLVHCAAGKDRTGVLVALALSLVGVKRDAVVADYTRTDERIEGIVSRLLSEPLYAEHAGGRTLDSFRPHAWNMERFLDRVDAEYGGVHGLAMSIGVDEETVARLSRRLLDV